MGPRIYLVFLLQLFLLSSRFPGLEGWSGDAQQQHLDSNAIPHHHVKAIESEHKLLLECQNSDYRTYIKCLKREKRHGSSLGSTRACLDECFEQNCTNSDCLRDCHSHCRKRLIETYSKTVETSFDCTDGTCIEHKPERAPNITTNIHIENILPNVTAYCKDRPEHSSNCTDGVDESNPKININNIINNQLSPGDSNCPCPGCNCNPYNNPWQSIPQITIGIGGGPIGGCMFSTSWPCYQRFPQQPPSDCSLCANPFLRYRCDPGCLPDPWRNHTQFVGGVNSNTQRPTTIHWNNINPRRP